ncbi:helix-turn-helix domain-containing protein [Actinokineospora enzanensis]|uniref:helix-turn-helix domain-containing protein n=1 Tax=Actinokineospora enzanensis TaxID=155975 RepID=UPI00035CF0A9|nr:helix-turn-helix transcriptional regulator [Actinokineospora enzanensis]
MNSDDQSIGKRIREIRVARKLSVTAAAGLAGISQSYLSMIERGQRAVTKRDLLENIANALRVSPMELAGKPYPATDNSSGELMAAMAEVADTLMGWRVGDVPDDVRQRPWEEVTGDLHVLTHRLRPNADYEGQAAMLPTLIPELLAAARGRSREAALLGLVNAYKAAASLARDVGVVGLTMLGAERIRETAEELGDPGMVGYAVYQRADMLSGTDRRRQYRLATTAAENEHARVETRGMAHLTAALSSAVQGDASLATTHLAEATDLAERVEADASPWMQTYFGRTNVRIWQVCIEIELGHGAKAAEIADDWHPTGIASSRQAMFWLDISRALSTERHRHQRGLAALLRAEKLAPQLTRNNAFAREIVTTTLNHARRDAGGRELRGLAYRMGVDAGK